MDIEGADGWLARMRPLIRTTRRAEVLADRGQFAGLFRLRASRFREPVLVASADGVGTKLHLARRPADHEVIGVDAVAMNVNDVVTYGAEPLFFLDYLAVGRLQPPLMTALLRGIVRGCRASGCALLSGETAELPGAYRPGEYDVAGFCVGIAERSRLVDGSRIRRGDVIVGLASSGLHANGFSLVRRALTGAQLARLRWRLLAPTRIYVRPVLRVLRHVPVRAISHVTGGGLSRRMAALVSARQGVVARLIPGSWRIPPVFHAIQRAGGISEAEMAATFNMGVGMALVCGRADARRLVRLVAQDGIAAWVVGTIERR